MLLYCLKCRKKAESKNLKVAKKNILKPIPLSEYVVRDGKKIEMY